MAPLVARMAADGHTVTLVGIGHYGDVLKSEWEICEISCLLQCPLVHLILCQPQLYRQLLRFNDGSSVHVHVTSLVHSA